MKYEANGQKVDKEFNQRWTQSAYGSCFTMTGLYNAKIEANTK